MFNKKDENEELTRLVNKLEELKKKLKIKKEIEKTKKEINIINEELNPSFIKKFKELIKDGNK
jgi:hypothetical protein